MKKKVLLVEDHPDIVTMYSTVFASEKEIDFYVAMNQHDGYEMAKEVRPDVMLVDLIIPDKKEIGFSTESRHGFDLIEQLRKDSVLKKTKVIVLTNIESSEDREYAKKLQALEYVVKSQVLPVDILKKIKKTLKLQ